MSNAKTIMALFLILTTTSLSMPSMAGSDGAIRQADRKGTWNFILPLGYAEGATIDGQGGSSVDLNEDFGIGFGAGYNFNDHFQLGGLFNYNSRSYDATAILEDGSSARYSNYMETSTIMLNGTYYILDKNFTPFVSGMLGYTWVDTNIQNGPAEGFCWWDPFWGYVCNEYVPTKTESDWTYGLGLGVRYDFNQSFSMQFSYNKSWVDFENASSTPDFDTWRLDFVFGMF